MSGNWLIRGVGLRPPVRVLPGLPSPAGDLPASAGAAGGAPVNADLDAGLPAGLGVLHGQVRLAGAPQPALGHHAGPDDEQLQCGRVGQPGDGRQAQGARARPPLAGLHRPRHRRRLAQASLLPPGAEGGGG
ncbi:hypothetical protein PTTG_29395, partial [Puccinia triticina 1-1 BBBD Race 1]